MTGLSITGLNIFNHLADVIKTYAAHRISMIISDSAMNVWKARQLICKKWAWILNSPDPCHILNFLAKDLVVGSKTYPKLSSFSELMAIVAAFTSYFSHSNYGWYWLDEEMKYEMDKQGIQAAGGTRFSTFSINAKSLAQCWDAIKHCYNNGKLVLEGKGSQKLKNLLQNEMDGLAFCSSLAVVIQILSPIERGLRTLEGLNTTLSDVFFVFAGIGVNFT